MKRKRKMLREAVPILLALFCLTFGRMAAFAQSETGQITIKATDPQGAVVPGATVSVKSTTTGATRTVTTNDEGVAVVSALQPGVYDVTVASGGFAPHQ